MHLFYDNRDDASHEARGSQILYWLDDLGAKPLSEATKSNDGFLFAGARPIEDYRRLVAPFPKLRDLPDERAPLLRLDHVLEAMERAGAQVPTPRTWYLPLDSPLPNDLTFPLFVRTAFSSLKLGGRISRVKNPAQLESEMSELRRLLGWNSLILARQWCGFAEAGQSPYGPVPQEIRVWIVDQEPFAWSFHYMNVVKEPKGFPPVDTDLATIQRHASRIGKAFQSRLVVADFARDRTGQWIFIEAGPGSCAGTAHEQVFKSVAAKLAGIDYASQGNRCGDIFRTESINDRNR